VSRLDPCARLLLTHLYSVWYGGSLLGSLPGEHRQGDSALLIAHAPLSPRLPVCMLLQAGLRR
jgi:hypothetical protein